MSAHDRSLIMVVDDSKSNVHVFTAVLKREDYRIVTADTGEAALEYLRSGEKPALILLDVMMPGLSGYDVLRILRENAATREIPVIILTADTSRATEEQGLELGADDFITKPVDLSLLMLRVRNILQRERLKHKQLEALREQLTKSAKLELLGKLVASFAHDIGSPIGNCLVAVSTVSENLASLQTQIAANTLRRSALNEFLDHTSTGMSLAQRNLERAHQLLESFKQRALDQATSQRRNLALRAWLDDLMLTVSPSFKGTQHRCLVDVPQDIELPTQPGPLGQVIVNLINNALLHGFEGKAAGTITITARQTDASVALTLADNGTGMSPEVQVRAFEPYFTTKAGRGGTGLGLDIVRHIVNDTLSGTLEMESAPGSGTRFTIHLPASTIADKTAT